MQSRKDAVTPARKSEKHTQVYHGRSAKERASSSASVNIMESDWMRKERKDAVLKEDFA